MDVQVFVTLDTFWITRDVCGNFTPIGGGVFANQMFMVHVGVCSNKPFSISHTFDSV